MKKRSQMKKKNTMTGGDHKKIKMLRNTNKQRPTIKEQNTKKRKEEKASKCK
jgi:hypothetical protein